MYWPNRKTPYIYVCMTPIVKKIILSAFVIAMASVTFSQVNVTVTPTTSLGSILQSNTSFVNTVYNEWTGNFRKSFSAGGETWTRISNFKSFDLNTPLNVTTIDVKCWIPYDIGVTYGTKTLPLLNNLDNCTGFPTNTITMSSTSTGTTVSFFSQTNWHLFTDTTYQSDAVGWAFYNITGTDAYLGFVEVGPRFGADYNDGVFLIQTTVPEPSTYAALLGMLTLGVVAIRRARRRSC